MEAMFQEPEVTLESLVSDLHKARTSCATQKDLVNSLERQHQTEHAEDYNTLRELRQLVECLEIEVKKHAIARYAETKDKSVSAGVTVKVFTRFRYAAEIALEWAKEHKLCLIPECLDTKAFDGICKSETSRPDFVERYEAEQAQIDSNLGKALGE